MKKEIERLHALGFALHWLKPKSKMPLESGWQKGPRKTVAELQKSYRDGYNLGVRLGTASKLKGGHLAVIDCDVKSAGLEHARQMQKKLKELINEAAPVVVSGRGNGSRHVYIMTSEPARPFRFSQSSDMVKVLMPSIAPSARDKAKLTREEVAAGYRSRPAWEISVMGEGQQVVLPPSIHPDSGRAYEWDTPLDGGLPVLSLEAVKPITERGKPQGKFTPAPYDLIGSPLPGTIVDMILTGAGVEDRSAAIMTAARAMVRAGATDNEIATVLTDPETFLGPAALERRGHNRASAAAWVIDHTVRKARAALDASLDFEQPESTVALPEAEAKAQGAEVAGDWHGRLDRTEGKDGAPGKVKATLKNVNLIFDNAVGRELFKYNAFACSDEYGLTPPWDGERVPGNEVGDRGINLAIHWLVERFGVEINRERILQAVWNIADRNKYHPVRDYLEALEWDGKPRLDTWLRDYLGASAPEPYLSDVSRKTICAMVARVYEPGVKADHVLIMEGVQGAGKSTAVRILSEPWFSDAHIDIADKDAVVAMRSVWVVELGELAGLRKADVNALKSFVSRQVDRVRLPYGRLAENFPRQCVFVGTTNPGDYLKDPTGSRRFWPVEVGRCDFKGLKRARDQLLAEAVAAWGLGEALYLDDKKSDEQAGEMQKRKGHEDSLVGQIADFLAVKKAGFDPLRFTLDELCDEINGARACIPLGRQGVAGQMRIAEALRVLGYEKVRMQKKGVQRVLWCIPLHTFNSQVC